MIIELFVGISLAFIIAGGLVAALTCSRLILLVGMFVLSLGILMAAVLMAGGEAAVLMAPVLLLIDFALMHILLSLQVQKRNQVEIQKRQRLSQVVICTTLVACFLLVTKAIWQWQGTANSQSLNDFVYGKAELWTENIGLLFICLVVLSPVAVGSLLLMRLREN